MRTLADQVETLWDRAPSCPLRHRGPRRGDRAAIDLLDSGEARVAEIDPTTDQVVVHQWLKHAILLLFRLRSMETIEVGPFEFADKLPLKHDYASGRRPGGAGRIGPVGLLPRPRGHLHAQLREHRGPGRGRDHGRHVGHGRLLRPDRRDRSTCPAASASAVCWSRPRPRRSSSRTRS